jgi:2-amino-4-hydroxy-6-hydroxymethyldihydropteridine diphosphokinase
MNSAVLLLGGNGPTAAQKLKKSLVELAQKLGAIKVQSALYSSESWGFRSNSRFCNLAVLVNTRFDPEKCLAICQEIEYALGRTRTSKKNGYSDREIDIDILYYNDLVFENDNLCLPHPKIQDRLFTLIPLKEILPDFVHPILQKDHKTLLSLCSDTSWVKKGCDGS